MIRQVSECGEQRFAWGPKCHSTARDPGDRFSDTNPNLFKNIVKVKVRGRAEQESRISILGKIFFLSIFIQKVKVTPLNQFKDLQILRFFPARYSLPALPEPDSEILVSVPLTP